jgi:hypothetical protein
MEGIFHPHGYERRIALPPNQRFVHYTNAAAALSVIQSRSLWMRNATVMNDFRELDHGLAMVNLALAEGSPRYDRLNKIADDCHPDAFHNAIKDFNTRWPLLRNNTFIASISEHREDENDHGRLSMWRAYGQNSAKVALVLRMPPPFSAMGLRVQALPVCYWSQEQLESEIDTAIGNIEKNAEYLKNLKDFEFIWRLTFLFISYVVSLKHVGFSEEAEWRLIYLPTILSSKYVPLEIESPGGIPQLVAKIQLANAPDDDVTEISIGEILARIIIGPSTFPVVLDGALRSALVSAGVDSNRIPIVASMIPLRT